MCFSAEASFVSGGLLLSAAAYNLYKRKPEDRKAYLLFIPIFFGIQQISEGFVWLGIDGMIPQAVLWFFIYLFSFMATSLWPAYMPYSALRFEENQGNKKILLFLSVGGFLLGAYLLWSSFFFSTLELKVTCSQIDCHSLAYLFDMPYKGNWINYLYLFFVIAPLAVSSHRRIRFIVAPAFFFSFVAEALLSKSETFPSVSCFFAALMSASIFLVAIDKENKEAGVSNKNE